MTSRTVEIGVGIFVALGMAALFMLAMKVSNLAAYRTGPSYEVTARFEDVSGLKVRSPVTMAGVRIGRVKAIEFDDEALQAVVTLEIAQRHNRLPRDTSASIYTAGLLGEKYIGLEPGGEEESLRPGDQIRLTQDSMVLEKLLSQFIAKFLEDKRQ
ncbi:MAG TPA: outer membrane lipid asymmetry maintenance protein MlaD [Thiotrichales bacterium]|nr:outer membrane lipid asymmetry maintenance protein MlaD [Thiotrichales bacterium]